MKIVWLGYDRQERLEPREQTLFALGVSVETFADADSLLRAFKKGAPDLLVLDVLIEGRNGFEVVEEVRKLPSGHHIPILLCSGVYRGSRFEREAERVGATALLEKPVPADVLRDWVERLVTPTM